MKARLDFASLTLRGALDFAVTIEEDAEDRYRDFARQVTDPAAAAFFREMVENEGKHRRQLESRRAVLFRHQPRRFEKLADAEGEAPSPDQVLPTISVRQAMEVALAAEVRAWEFYDQAIPHLTDPDVRAFFEDLRAEEVEHQQLLEDMLAKLPPGT